MSAFTDLLFKARIIWFQNRIDKFFADLIMQLNLEVPLGKFLLSRHTAADATSSFSAPVLGLLQQRVAKGDSLSESGVGIFSELNILMIEAGERVDNLQEGVKTARFMNQSMQKILDLLIDNLKSPVVYALAAIGVVGFFGTTVIPDFAVLLPLKDLGPSFQIVSPLVNWFVEWIWVVTPILIFLSGLLIWSVTNWTGRVRNAFDIVVPPYNLYRQKKAAEFLIIVSGLMRHGIPFDEILRTIEEREGRYMRWHIGIMRDRIANGLPIVGGIEDGQLVQGALDTGLLPGAVIEQLISFNESERLEEAMKKIGFENVDEMLLIVKSNVVVIAGILKYLAWTVIGFLAYDTVTLSARLSALSHSGQF